MCSRLHADRLGLNVDEEEREQPKRQQTHLRQNVSSLASCRGRIIHMFLPVSVVSTILTGNFPQ
jgi:hypothetical protein